MMLTPEQVRLEIGQIHLDKKNRIHNLRIKCPHKNVVDYVMWNFGGDSMLCNDCGFLGPWSRGDCDCGDLFGPRQLCTLCKTARDLAMGHSPNT